MSKEEFKAVLNAKNEYIVEYPENIETIMKIIKDTNLKVSLMNSDKTRFENLLKLVFDN